MSKKKALDCKLKYRFYTVGKDNTHSRRATMCCRYRYGMFLSDMKCVGLGNKLCPITHPELANKP